MPHLKDLSVEWVSLVDRPAVRDPSAPSEPQPFLLFKRESGAPTDPVKGGTVSKTADELSADLAKAEQERDELAAKVTKLEKKLEKASKKDEPQTIDKSDLPPAVRDALEKAEKAAQENAERLEKAEKLAKAEQDLRVTREFVAKAESEFANVGGDSAEFGPLLKAASEKLSKEEYDALEKRLRAAEEQVRSGLLFKQAGMSGDPVPSTAGETDLATLTQKAQELKKADPSLSEYEAMHRAMAGNREAQAGYLAGVR